jgi:arylsulfatase A-like enzyme
MSRTRVFILILLLIGLLSSCKEKKQNFLFILVDDLGWTDLGYSGSTFYETPNIDALAHASIQFTNAYASGSVCSPSRAAIITGKHPARLQITDWIPGSMPKDRKLLGPEILNQLPLEEKSLAEILKKNNYSTFFAGKWHLGDEGFYPEDQGFDINKGGHDKGSPPGGYYTPYKNPKLSDGPAGEYLTDRLTNESIHFMDSIGENPFFLYLCYYTVHTPIQPNKEYIDKFNEKLEALGGEEIAIRKEGSGVTVLEQKNPAYASMLYALDKNIGRLITKLKEKGLYGNTTIIFTSDNGGLSTLSNNRKGLAPTSVVPLRGGKGWLYEGGIRVPLLIKPKNYKDKSRICDEPVIGHDFYPTIISMAGLKKDENVQIDGIDLSPVIFQNKDLGSRELFWHYPHYHGSAWTPGAAILQDNWKLIELYESDSVELYYLSEDISEQHELSLVYPDKKVALLSRLHQLQDSLNAKPATKNPYYIR